jgi:K+ transporter
MGHFGAWPIRISWTFFVLPALVLNYFGRAALIVAYPRDISICRRSVGRRRSACWLWSLPLPA